MFFSNLASDEPVHYVVYLICSKKQQPAENNGCVLVLHLFAIMHRKRLTTKFLHLCADYVCLVMRLLLNPRFLLL